MMQIIPRWNIECAPRATTALYADCKAEVSSVPQIEVTLFTVDVATGVTSTSDALTYDRIVNACDLPELPADCT